MKRFSKNLTYILFAFFFNTLLIVSQISAQCSPSCSQTTNLNFSTGWDETAGALINAGQIDPHWRLMNTPPLTGTLPNSVVVPNAYAVNPFQANWNVIPGSMPISMASQAGFGQNNANGAQPWRFRRYFCICEDTEVEFIGEMRADDTGSLILYDSNGNPMPFSETLAPAPNTNNFNVGIPFNQGLFLPAGNYYFEFSLENTNGVASGFAVQGTMISSNSLSLYDEQLGCCAVSVITGQKILDNDCSETFDPNVDEIGVGFVFDLIDNNTGNIIATTQSDGFGEFEFNNVQPGSYTVRERQEFGWFSIPISFQVNLAPLDVETVTFFNCPIEQSFSAGCVYGDITTDIENIHNEKGLAIIHNGGFFDAEITHAFSSTSVPLGISGDQHIIGKQRSNVTNIFLPNATLNDFSDASNQGAHSVENLHVLKPNMPCLGGTFTAVGTTANGSNLDVFYSEYSTNGTMLFYADITSTPAPDRESVHEFIELENDELMWVGTQRLASSFPSFNEPMISKLINCQDDLTHHVFNFQDNNGQVAATGRSVLELSIPLPGHPNAKYAMTGIIGTKTYLLLLDSACIPVFALAYDIDGNTSSREEGIRIRREGDNLFILGNSGPIDISNPFAEKIFLLKLGFSAQQSVPTILTNKLYDIPNGGEKIVDAEINFNGDLILTGISELPNPFLVVSGAPEEQKTFLMGLDSFGNQLWLNQVQLQEGSEPADLQFRPLLDEINIIGTCWTNEISSIGGPVVNVRKFDEMIIQATFSGDVGFNTGCTIPLDAVVSEPLAVISDFIATPSTPEFTIENGEVFSQDYFIEIESCPEDDGGLDCDSLQITQQMIVDPTNGSCCFSLDYKNNSPVPLYELFINISGSPSPTFTNISTNSNFNYTLLNGNTILKINSAVSSTLPTGNISGAFNFCISGATNASIYYLWEDNGDNIVCEQAEDISCSSCEADFTWTADCCNVQLDGIANGTGPFTYEWDINCDNPTAPELTGQSVNWSFNTSGTYDICLKVTDTATGCISTIQKQVTVVDIPPALTCPSDITISMDPGLYIATHQLVDPTVIDDCTTMFTIGCLMSGATTGQANSPVSLNSGVTTINCSTEDSKGQSDDCSYTITVEDNEAPVINCPTNINQNIPLCEGGLNVTLPPTTFSDNCPNATMECSHQSGDYFTCGVTTVTCTATDMAGNITTCSYNVIVNCQCIETVIGELSCSDVDNEYEFSVEIYDFSGSNGNCNGTVTTTQTGVNIVSQTSSTTTNPIVVTGVIQLASPPIPTNIVLTANMFCVCPDGNNIECSQNVSLAVPCCKEISVEPQEVCNATPTISVPLVGCNNLFDVQQVRWYISDTPCPPQGSYGAPFQVTNNCSPLILEPKYHNTDICVYAEIDMGSGAGPCTSLTSNTAIITLCEPIVCSVNSEEHCYFGTAITPGLLTASISSDTIGCFVSAKWYDENNVQIGNGLTYQPPALDLSSGSQACSESFTYRCEISNICGTSICSGTVTLHNDDAPLGDLYLNPNESMPFCPGEDAALQYDKACAGSPPEWNWSRSNDNFVTDNTPLPSNGNMNDTYLTNRLYQDTWIRVEKQNGTCPADTIEFFIDVTDSIAITNFTAVYTAGCNPTDVDMNLAWTPNYSAPSTCDFTIDWYRNGVLLSSTIQNTSPVTYTHTGGVLSGNYYAIIRDNCCGQAVKSTVITVAPPMEVVIVGPCFRCKCDTVILEAVIENEYVGCTYQWLKDGVIMTGETGSTLTILKDSICDIPFFDYTFEISYSNGCSDMQTYRLPQCGDCKVGTIDIPKINAVLYPNPTTQHITIDFEQSIDANTYVEIIDLAGRRVAYEPIARGAMYYNKDLSKLTAGLYLVTIVKDGVPIYSEKFVKE